MVLEMATNGPRKILANFLFADSVRMLIVHAHMTEQLAIFYLAVDSSIAKLPN